MGYIHGWHIDFICAHLQAITFGKFLAMGWDNRLLVNIPPSFMKSLIVSVFWPAWEWGPCGMPHLQYIATSHRDDFCIRDARRMRTLVQSEWFQKHWPISFVKDGEKLFENDRGGKREAIPFGSLMGGKCDRLLIDDPHSVDSAESDADRDRATMRFRESATTRLNDPIKSAIVVIMQRLHEKDIAGIIIALKLRYIRIRLPMRFEADNPCETPLGRDQRLQEGELLFPERFPLEVVDRDEKAMTAYAVASQHQQRPGPRGGLTFKRHWFKIVKAAPVCRWIRGWDLAGSEEKTAAFSAGVLLGFCQQERRYYVGGVARARTANVETMIKNIASQDGKGVEIDIPQDPGQAGKIQARSLAAALSGYRVSTSPESGDKVQRAQPVADQAEVGNFCVVDGEWTEAFLDELTKFPTGQFKDQVDALSRAFGRFVQTPGAVIMAPIVVTSPLDIIGSYQ